MNLAVAENPILRIRPEDAQREIEGRTALNRRSSKRKLVSAMQCRNAIAELQQLPGTEESLHIVCRGNFPLWSIVPAVLEIEAPATIEQLCIATLGFSKSNAGDLIDLLDKGRIRAVAIVASVYFERQNPAEWQMMHEGLVKRGQRIVALRSHAKVITMRLSDGRGFAVEASANLRSCRNIEQICITESRELCEFHQAWIEKACNSTDPISGRRKNTGCV